MELNPLSFEFHEDPYPTYAWLRTHAPLHYHPTLDFDNGCHTVQRRLPPSLMRHTITPLCDKANQPLGLARLRVYRPRAI